MTRNSFFLRVDRTYLVPFFTRLRPRTRVDETPNDADIDEFELVNWRSNERAGESSTTEEMRSTSAATSTDSETQPTAIFASSSTEN